MHPHYPLIFAAALIAPLSAQVPVVPPDVVVEEIVEVPPATAVEETVVETVTPAGDVITEVTERVDPAPPPRFDPALARRQLSIVPKAIPLQPGEVIESTETTTTVERPGLPPRVYNVERNVVVVEGRELPYITIPVLFEKETARLLDVESRVALDETAAAIREVLANDPTARFDIEGHTSTDGTEEFNLQLSADRARRVYDELVNRYEIPASALSAHGYGENYPAYPSGTEQQMMLDRRVLVVRVK